MKHSGFIKRKPILITWRDSRRYTYQMTSDEENSICIITSVGFLVKKEKDRYVICQDLIDDDFRGVMTIPRENVISAKFL